MTHDTTRDDDFTADTPSEPEAQPGQPGPAGDDATVPFTPLTAIPVPPRPAAPEERVPADDPSGDAPGEREATSRDSGASAWFSKLRGGRTEPARNAQTTEESTPESPPRFSGSAPDPAPAPEPGLPGDASAAPASGATPPGTDAAPVKRIVFVGKTRSHGPAQEVAAFLGVDGTALSAQPFQIVLGGGAALTLIALLANNAGLALTVLSAIVPVLLLIALTGGRGDLASDRTIMLAVTGLGGVIAGGVLGWIAARITASSWFDDGVLNFGAAGFGGRFAHAAGNAGWLIWLVVGIVLPVVALAAAVALPVVLRRSGRFPETTGNGRLLGAAAGAGYAIGTAAVFWSPLNLHAAPGFSVSDWTLMVIGIAVLQPVVAVLALAALGVAIWRYLEDQQIAPAIPPAACALGGVLLMRLGSIWIQPRQEHLWLELCWIALVGAVVIVLYRLTATSMAPADRR